MCAGAQPFAGAALCFGNFACGHVFGNFCAAVCGAFLTTNCGQIKPFVRFDQIDSQAIRAGRKNHAQVKQRFAATLLGRRQGLRNQRVMAGLIASMSTTNLRIGPTDQLYHTLIHAQYSPKSLRPKLRSWRVSCKVVGFGQHMVNGGNNLPVHMPVGERAQRAPNRWIKAGHNKKEVGVMACTYPPRRL